MLAATLLLVMHGQGYSRYRQKKARGLQFFRSRMVCTGSICQLAEGHWRMS